MEKNISVKLNRKNPIKVNIQDKEKVGVKFKEGSPNMNYNSLLNLPEINGKVIKGDMTLEELGIENDKNYVHNQTTASDTWVINHNLNKYPAVSVIDSANNEVIGDIEYDNTNQVTITFTSAFKGKATLN